MSPSSTRPAKFRRPRPVRTEAAPARDDLFALTRALVFTKEAYRTLKTRSAPRPTPPAAAAVTHGVAFRSEPAVQGFAQSLHGVGQPESFPITAAAGAVPQAERPLTPWDLMDESDARGGVTFAAFQRRPAASDRLVQDAA